MLIKLAKITVASFLILLGRRLRACKDNSYNVPRNCRNADFIRGGITHF